MAKKSIILLPETEDILAQMGLRCGTSRNQSGYIGIYRKRNAIGSDRMLRGSPPCT